MVNKGIIYISDVSGNLASLTASGELKIAGSITTSASISGQPVAISGQTVTIAGGAGVSGQTVYLPDDSVNNVVKISGQTVIANAIVSGGITVSGQPVRISGSAVSVSGNVVQISGQTVTVSNNNLTTGVSGQTVYLVDDSVNNKVKISGQLVAVSGSIAIGNTPNVIISGGALSGLPVTGSFSATADISGQTVITRIWDSSSNQFAEIVSGTTSLGISQGTNAIVAAGLNYAWDEFNSQWGRMQLTRQTDGFKLAVSISGQPITGSFTANSNISGQTIYLVNDGVNNVVSISGQTIVGNFAANVSGQPVRTSGQVTYLINDGVNNVVAISGQTVVASVSLGTTPTSGDAVRISGQIIYLIDDSVNNKVKISGQLVVVSGIVNIGNTPNVIISGGALSGLAVTGSFAASVSGQPVRTSGQTIYFVNDGVNNIVSISGQTVVANVNTTTNISGQAIRNSGQTIYFANDGVNNVVSISGQTVVASVVTNISGQAIRTSGQTIYLIDDSVNNKIKISGQLVVTSGTVTTLSGSVVQISGQTITINPVPPLISGDAVRMSGQTIYFVDDSVNNKVKISGQLVAVSGLVQIIVSGGSISGAVNTISGNVVRVSGETVSVSGIVNIGNAPTVLVSGGVHVSGDLVAVSGIVRMAIPTAFRTRPLLACASLSGGTQLLSGDVRKATLINAGVSGTIMYVGSTTDPPFSGKGIYLSWGNGITIETDNFNRLWVCAFASGQLLSYGGEQY